MGAIISYFAVFFMPVIAFWFMFRFLKHFSKQNEGIALTSVLFALIIWTFSSSILLAGGG
ncbi:hypothetical protein ACIQXF_21920 [Lysinibacillus sp. NPDC097231]|uniref:hypothetical protein n=1 Tax=Lysinibacillus sp. NPDC097231 TaxID=3364142 RepID=UPI0037F90B8E